jgi:hypothetical protein
MRNETVDEGKDKGTNVLHVVLDVLQSLYLDLRSGGSVSQDQALELRFVLDAAQQAMDTLGDFIQVNLHFFQVALLKRRRYPGTE